ncbi:MAG: hypothetical protein KC933_20315 [Myxococcales bacterium]|nr:hypothetical protein [Myxococcales bacterium]MCB9646315.1 hypothetical protein [Deltaproteobacteria bacterium]
MKRASLSIFAAAALAGACAGPSAAQRAEQDRLATLMMEASAVHMPPAGVDSCVGVTLRLSDPSGKDEPERAALEGRFTEAEVGEALAAAGVERCKQAFLDGLYDADLASEPLQVTVAFGVDPLGQVCAVVERGRSRVIDPGAGPFVDQAATCLKDALFRAQLPAERVKDTERVVRFYSLAVQETATSSTAAR